MRDRHRGFLSRVFLGLGRGLGFVAGLGVLGAGAGAVGALVYGMPVVAGAILGVLAVAGIALFIFFAGYFE